MRHQDVEQPDQGIQVVPAHLARERVSVCVRERVSVCVCERERVSVCERG